MTGDIHLLLCVSPLSQHASGQLQIAQAEKRPSPRVNKVRWTFWPVDLNPEYKAIRCAATVDSNARVCTALRNGGRIDFRNVHWSVYAAITREIARYVVIPSINVESRPGAIVLLDKQSLCRMIRVISSLTIALCHHKNSFRLLGFNSWLDLLLRTQHILRSRERLPRDSFLPSSKVVLFS